MECKQCGKILSEQERFCTYCGYYYDPNEDNENLKSVELNSKTGQLLTEHNQRIEIDYEDKNSFTKRCLKAYFNADYKNVMTGGFNLYALLFSWIYFIYKKMYLIGITGLLIATILVLFQKVILIIYAVLSMILSGIFFNKIYKYFASKKIDKILAANNNPHTILKLVKKAGRENIILTLGIYFIFLVAVVVLYINADNFLAINDKFWKDNSSNKATCLSMINTAKSISNTNAVAFIIEAECVVVDRQTERFEVYLKFDKGNQYVIEKYKTENQKMYFEGSNDLLKEYENKKNTLNDSEKKYYEEMLKLDKKYNEINKIAKQEEELIKKGANKAPRNNFIFTNEEVNR